MAIIGSLPFNIVNGTLEDASQVMANFNAIVTALNSVLPGVGGASQVGAAASTYNVGATVQAQLTNIGGSTGAAYVGYMPSGSGGVAITLNGKLNNDLISIKDYGAVGNGVANDTGAQTAMFTQLQALGGGIGVRSPGSYLLNSVKYFGGFTYIDPAFPLTLKQQQRSNIQVLSQTASATEAVAGIASILIDGTVAGSTLANFIANQGTDTCALSAWALRGGATGTNFMESANFGIWLENNTQSGWAVEIDVENYGANGSGGQYGIGLVFGSSSTYNPYAAMWVGWEGTAGNGWQRGLWINGVQNGGAALVIEAQATYAVNALYVDVFGDPYARYTLDQNGGQQWATGAAVSDVQFYRTAAGQLTINTNINSNVNAANLSFASAVSANAATTSNIFFNGLNSSAANKGYAGILQNIVSNTASSESGSIQFYTLQSGANAMRLTIQNGLLVGPGQTDKGAGTISASGGFYGPGGTNALIHTTAAITNGSGVSAGTISNAPSVGNPTKWCPIDDNGTIRYFPAW